MKYISDLIISKIYSNIQIMNIKRKEKDEKDYSLLFNDCIIQLGNNNDDLINLINSNLFSKMYYKNMYTDKYLYNIRGKKIIFDRSKYYKDINSNTNISLIFKKDIKDYKKKNVYYDLFNYIDTLIKSNNKKGNQYYFTFIENLLNKIISINKVYKNLVLYIPIYKNNNEKNFTSNIFYKIFTKKILRDRFISILKENNINELFMLFYSVEDNKLISFNLLDENIKPIKFVNRVKNFYKLILRNTDELEEDIDSEEDKKINNTIMTKEDKIINLTSKIVDDKIINLLGMKDKNLTNRESILLSKLSDEVSKEIENSEEEDIDEESILTKLENNDSFKKVLEELSTIQQVGTSNTKKIEKLRDKQDNIKVEGKTIKDIIKKVEDTKLDKEEFVSDKIDVINDDVKHTAIKDYDNTYMKKHFEKDITNVFTAFNDDEDIQIFLDSYSYENSSTDFTKKRTLTVKLKDSNNLTHQIKIDVPIIKDGRYMYINGSNKIIAEQFMTLPIVKTNADEVRFTSSYNKFFIRRFGTKINTSIEVLKKFLSTEDLLEKYYSKDSTFKFKLGNVERKNRKYNLNLYYVLLSEYLDSVETQHMIIDFNYERLDKIINNENNDEYDNKLAKFYENIDKSVYQPIGYSKDKKNLYVVAINDNTIFRVSSEDKELKKYESEISKNIIRFIIDNIIGNGLTEEGHKYFNSITRPKTLTYNRIAINNKEIPLIIIMGYEYGLINVLRKYNINFIFSSTNKKSDLVKENVDKIKFKDGYMYFSSERVRDSLLLFGLKLLNTEEYNLEEFGKTGKPYIDYFGNSFSSRNIGKGIHNTISLMLDPKTKEILEMLQEPTEMIDILLYCNTLLEDNSTTNPSDLNYIRIRRAEQISSLLYKIIADAVRTYKDTAKNGNPIKISVPQDILIKKVLENAIVEENPRLNPSLDLEKTNNVSFKGPNMVGLDYAFTQNFRTYDKSMLGVCGSYSPGAANIGINRQLSYNPSIVNSYGFLEPDRENKNGNTDIYAVSELLNPFSATHSDPPRLTMMSKQQAHLIPTKVKSKPLIGSGVEKSIAYLVSDSFVFKAKEDGKIIEIDEKTNLAIIEYKSGKKDIIDLNTIMTKNSAAGFYMSTNMELTVKVGENFKKNDILAKDPDYFLGNNRSDVQYVMGKRCKVAIASSDRTLEDSCFISSHLSSDMSTKMNKRVAFELGPNANIDFLIEKGTKVNTGDPLIKFENAFEDESINEILAKLGSDFEETVDSLSKNTYRSKVSGVVKDIQIFYTRDIEEFSESIQKILKKYIREKESIKKLIYNNVSEEDTILMNLPVTSKQEDGKIKGKIIDGIQIEFYLEYEDLMSVGDKVTFYGACKCICSDVIPYDEMPYSELHPEEEIDAVCSPLSLNSRMTVDISYMLYACKDIIEGKRLMKKIYDSF